MFGFRLRGQGFRPYWESTCLRKNRDTGTWMPGIALGWVK